MRSAVLLVLALVVCAQIALATASEPAAASKVAKTEVHDLSAPAPVPPAGAVLSADKLKAKAAAVKAKRVKKAAKKHPAGSIQAKNSKAAAFLASLRAPVAKPKSLRLKRSDVVKASRKFDAIVAAQKKRPLPTEENSGRKAVRAARAKRAIARNVARALRRAKKALAKVAAGTLTAADLAKLQGKPSAKQLEAKKRAEKKKKRSRRSKKPSKASLAQHANKKEAEYTSRIAKKKAAARRANKRAQKKLAAVQKKAAAVAGPAPVAPAAAAKAPAVARSLVQLSSSSPVTDKDGALCPNCQQVVLNANSPLSANDKKILAAQHDNLALGSTQLHGQAALDTAAAAVADAEAQRKELLAKFPAGAQDSLMQLSEHN